MIFYFKQLSKAIQKVDNLTDSWFQKQKVQYQSLKKSLNEPTCRPKHKHTWQISIGCRTRVYVETTQLSPLFVKDDTYRIYFSLLLWNAKLWKFRETSTKFGCW